MLPLLLAAAIAAVPDTLVVPLTEVVVTGSRLADSLWRIPAAISLVDRSRYEHTRGLNLKDALSLVPGLFVQSRSGGQDVRVTIRGFGARGNGERSNAGSMRGIRVITDGVPLTEPDGRTSLELVDLDVADRIEISRSNASALYGNASGGVVHLRSDLDFDRPFFEVRSRAGSFGFHREHGVVGFHSGAATGTFSLRASEFEGWREHSSASGTHAALRLALPVNPESRFGILLDGVSDLQRYPGALTAEQIAAAPRLANPRYVTRDERRFHRLGRAAMTFDRSSVDGGTLAVMAYVEPKVLQRSERDRFRDFTRYHLGGGVTYRRTHELAPGLESRSSVGADEAFQDGSIQFYSLTPDGGRGTALRANKREAANSAGAFAQQELTWNRRWTLRAAARFDQLYYLAEDRVDPAINAHKVFKRWTPIASLSYATDHHSLYTSLGGGVEAPAFNEIDPSSELSALTSLNPLLDAAHSTTYEAGGRGEIRALGLGRVRYDAAVYWIDVRNDLVPFEGGAYFMTAGKTRRKGIELGLDWIPVPRLRLGLAGHVSDNRYVDYANNLGDFAGHRVPGLPRVTFQTSARADGPAGLTAEVATETVGNYFADDSSNAEAAGYTLLHSNLGWTRPVGGLSVRAFVAAQNLLDRRHVASVFINGVNREFFESGLPRNWAFGVTLVRRSDTGRSG